MASRQKNQRKTSRSRGAGTVRIISGEWRGRKLPVAEAPGLRPTGDRVRETLFNWLQGKTYGARCADLFAGSGALGFEAASRGAKPVILVERSRPLAASLRDTAASLDGGQIEVVHDDALSWLAGRGSNGSKPGNLDLVFVDPPFDSDLAARALKALLHNGVLADDALVYLECPKGGAPGEIRDFVAIKCKTMGEVEMHLLAAGPSIER